MRPLDDRSPVGIAHAAAGVVAAFGLVAGIGCAAGGAPQADGGSAEGDALYGAYCVSCHGAEGDGQGPAAYLLFPKPRNFQAGQFKLRSTAQGQLPTDEDLIRTVRDGVPGTSMFEFGGLLSDGELQAVVEHVKSLAPAFATSEPPTPEQMLAVPPAPPRTDALVSAGEITYARFGCDKCHGPEGRGDGPSAPTLRDSEGDPFPAADFTFGVYRSGGSPEALYRTFLTGMAGTPMPSFDGALESDEQAWGLVYYVLSLAPGGLAQTARSDPGPIGVASLGDASALTDPWSPEWDVVAPTHVALRPLWYRNDFPPLARVRAARTDEQLAVLVEWRDPSNDTDALRTEDFPDGVALQFALVDPPPFVGMGHDQAGGQVEIWYWRGDRQAALDGGASVDVTAVYPDLTVDRYPYATFDPDVEQEAPFITGRDAGNPVSDPQLLRRPVHSLAAAGFGTLTSRPADEMRAAGDGAWRDGVYRVLLSAPLRPSDTELEADFTAGPVPMAVAIWDGAAGDRNGTKLVSQWLLLDLAAPPPTAVAERTGRN